MHHAEKGEVMQKTRLKTAQLGNTGLEITRVGFGAWAIGGGGWEFGWGPQDDEESIEAIHRALELGVNWIDTAAAYGFGHSERLPEDDWRKHDPRFQDPQLSRHLALVGRLERVAERHDVTPGAVAAAWTLRNPAVDGAIVGFRAPDQVDPIITAADLELSDEDVAEIEGRR
jgi:aryl-alcohol dehydrogenase-like predicted oxidoreductase